MPKKICIVTPDIVGPMRNGGIGTACYWLARFLAQNGYEVSVLYTGPFENASFAAVCEQYAEHQVEFLSLSELKDRRYVYFGADSHGEISERVYALLKQRTFDVVHFQDWRANGFAAIQAKRMGVAFARTKLVVAVHSPLLWETEGMQTWSPMPDVDFRRDYLEKYAIEHADAVWAPSEAMLRWLDAHGIVPRGPTRVIRYLIRPDDAEPRPPKYVAKTPAHLAFFGRLETRKGLELFVSTVNKLLSSGAKHGIERISFLGKVGTVQIGNNALYYLSPILEKWKERGIECKVIDNYDTFQAIRYIQKTGAIAVIPSLLDNYPYTVLECIQHGLPCLASSVGGIPEMLSVDVIFEPKVEAFATALLERTARVQKMRGLYSRDETKKDWLEYSAELAVELPVVETTPSQPRVSVCVAYYNYGAYLPHLMRSLKENDYANFEVIVVNDGSTDAASVKVFEEQKKELSPRGWKFVSQENQGIGATRNFAASLASGEHLIFMDADNVAAKQMISVYVKALEKSGVDVLTCIATVFRGDVYPDATTPVYYLYRPAGPILEMGMLENVFGDANAIIRKKAFDEVGGFRIDRTTSYEDWELLALFALKGYQLDVVPEQLFYYRHLGEGFSRTTNAVQNQKRVLRAYLQNPGKINLDRLVHGLFVPLFYANHGLIAQVEKLKPDAPATAPDPR